MKSDYIIRRARTLFHAYYNQEIEFNEPILATRTTRGGGEVTFTATSINMADKHTFTLKTTTGEVISSESLTSADLTRLWKIIPRIGCKRSLWIKIDWVDDKGGTLPRYANIMSHTLIPEVKNHIEATYGGEVKDWEVVTPTTNENAITDPNNA